MAAKTTKTTSKGYDPNKDYSKELQRTDLTSAQRSQLERERQNKINDRYGGVEPNLIGSNKTYSQTYGGSSGSANTRSPSGSASKDGSNTYASGSASKGGSNTYASGAGTSYGIDYHQQAKDAAARGDWDAVSKALADRQAKIDRQGGNDRGNSNAQILSQLRSQYGGSYDALSSGSKDNLNLNAGARIPYDTSYGTTGQVYKDQGWQAGTDYLAQAQRLAQAGDLEGAYEALMRRGFKMADTGSQGGGTTQDQAYAQIHQLYNQSDVARQQYQNQVETNRQRLQGHQTQFGMETRPELANRRLLSTDGQYVIYYDASGTPAVAMPSHNTRVGGASSYIKRSPEEIALLSQYYNGDESTDFAELGRQIHNLNVARTGVGRLIDQGGNYASGTPVQPVTANGWTGLPQTDRYQDKAALRAILERVNAGRTYDGGSAQVPTDELAMRLSAIPTGGTGGVGLSGGAGPARGSSASSWGGGYADYGTISNDLISYLRQIYEDNLTAQLAALRAAYERNTADYRANDDLIAQAYRDQRNQAAAQNDLQRLYLAETGAMQGLNTGAFGQLALAQSADYQGALAELLAAERQDRSANDLALRKLSVAYQGDVATAQAQSGAELAQAVYNELARQMEAEEAARGAAQAQANWEAQFAYQQRQDALDRAYQQAQWDYSAQRDQRSSAYDLAAAMLRNGILPDSATLATAGISSADAASVVRAYQQAALQSTKRSGSGGGSSGGSKSSGTGKPSMTHSQIMGAIENGQVTDAVRSGYDYFMGSGAYDQFYGGGGETSGGTTGSGGGSGMNSAYFNQMGNSISTMLARGKGDSAVSALDGVWGQLSNDQRDQIQRLFNRYGYAYQP